MYSYSIVIYYKMMLNTEGSFFFMSKWSSNFTIIIITTTTAIMNSWSMSQWIICFNYFFSSTCWFISCLFSVYFSDLTTTLCAVCECAWDLKVHWRIEISFCWFFFSSFYNKRKWIPNHTFYLQAHLHMKLINKIYIQMHFLCYLSWLPVIAAYKQLMHLLVWGRSYGRYENPLLAAAVSCAL